jgi:type IV secretory pathway VirB4 component
MQLLPGLAADAKATAREAPAGRHLPFARHVDRHTIETRDGLLMQVVALRGLLFETADTEEINYRKQLRDAMLQAIGDPRFAFFHHLVRRPIEARLICLRVGSASGRKQSSSHGLREDPPSSSGFAPSRTIPRNPTRGCSTS